MIKCVLNGMKSQLHIILLTILCGVASVIAFCAYYRALISLFSEGFYISNLMSVILAIVIISFCIINLLLSYFFYMRRTNVRYQICKIVGAKSYQLVFMRMTEIFSVFTISYFIGLAIDLILGSILGGIYLPDLGVLEYCIVYFVTCGIVMAITIMSVVYESGSRKIKLKKGV